MSHSNAAEHDGIVELLPWYVTGTLKPDEQARIEQHLAGCAHCRQEIQFYRQLEAAKPESSTTQAWQPSAAHFSSIMDNIDESEKSTQREQVKSKASQREAKWKSWFKTTPNPLFWLVSLETVALAALVVLVVGQPLLPSKTPVFETLSNASSAAKSNLPRLHVVFADDTTVKEIGELLQKQQAQLVSGPSAMGVYTLELPVADHHAVQKTLGALRNDPKVKLVEELKDAVGQ